jgi:Regulator of chromosome condensation (RCC1) repeat
MFRKMQFYQRMLLIMVAWSGLIAAPQAFAAYKQITAGYYHTCGLKTDGSAICWGWNNYGQTTVPAGTFTQLSAGGYHTCGLKSDGSAVCWGAGKTNAGPYQGSEYGQSIAPSGTFTQLSAGQYHTCGLKTDGSAVCWGAGEAIHKFGDVDCGQSIVPSGTFTQLSAGSRHTCGLKSDGSAICWGGGGSAVCLWGSVSPPNDKFTQLSASGIIASGIHACGLKSDGTVICWGIGQLPAPSNTFTQISMGGYHVCGLKNDGSADCWGAGKTNNGINPEYGQSIVPSGTFTQLSAGRFHTCGLKSDGSAVCWGIGKSDMIKDNYGQSIVPDDNGYFDTNGSTQAGIMQCKTNPASCGITDTNGSTQTGIDQCKANPVSCGIIVSTDQCKTNPTSCNLFTQAQIDAAKQAGIVQCKANPASCGITKLDGISTNAFITPANKMIAGVLISGGTKRLMVRASSVDGAVDPLLEIVTYPDRKPLGNNDSWATDPAAAELTQKKLAPARATDAATIINLPPGLFTMEITSKNGGSGAGLIEVYDMAVFP